MLKKNYKKSLLLVFGLLLFSALMLNLGYGKNFAYIEYPYQSFCKFVKLGGTINLGIINFPPVSSCIKYIYQIPFGF